MGRTAVVYAASDGYLFQTLVSALQSRAHTSAAVDVAIVHLGAGSDERARFRSACEDNGIEFIEADASAIDGMHPMFARLFLDRLLPEEVEEVLYLDGDTQVVDSLEPLLSLPLGGDDVLAARDPMVIAHAAGGSARRIIGAAWDRSGIPEGLRARYVNSGMLRFARSTLPGLRADVLDRMRTSGSRFRFADQDALNLAASDRLKPVSMRWNFPGFILGTQMQEIVAPAVVHFMSDPRPWNAALHPWGDRFHEPYRELASARPELAAYWRRFSRFEYGRYALQQQYKRVRERPNWERRAAADALRALESDVLRSTNERAV